MRLLCGEEKKTKRKGKEYVKKRPRALVRKALNLTSPIHVATLEEDRVHVMKVYTSMNRIALFINFKLSSFGNYVLNKRAVVEKLMASCIIRPHIPPYYLLPNEAKVQHALVQGLKAKLQEVKGV
jgi:hypothetical protein